MSEGKILIIDDEAIVRDVLGRALRDMGYQVKVASSAHEGLQQATQDIFDVALVDIVLPDESGVEVLRTLRALDEELKVLIITSHPSPSTAAQVRHLGAFDYHLKPLEFDRVLLSVRNALEARRLARHNRQLLQAREQADAVLEAITQVLREAPRYQDEEEVAYFCLELARELTQSEAGLIVEIDEAGRPKRLAISDGRGASGPFADIERMMAGEAKPCGLCQQAIEGMTPVIINDVASHPEGASLPPGHPPLRSLLMAPLVRDGHLGGLIVLANRASGYGSLERRAIEALSAAFVEVLTRGRIEQERGELRAQFLQAQRLETIGRLAGMVAHEFNNRLTPIQGYAYIAMQQVEESSPLRRDLEEIHYAAVRTARFIRQLLLFSRRAPTEFRPLNLNRTIEELLKMLTPLIGEDIALHIQLDPELRMVKGDEGKLEQVIMNLVINARDAMPQGGELIFQTENVTFSEAVEGTPCVQPGQFVRLSVADTGIGMDEEVKRHLFEPFFTTKEEGKGTGLGLLVVRDIVREHRGWIEVESEAGVGSTFTLYLPAVSTGAEMVEETEGSAREPQGHGEGVLVVEDDAETREFISRVLREKGYLIFEAANASEAQRVFAQHHGQIHLLFSDVVLPDGTGLDLADRLLALQRDLGIVLSSGYTDERSRQTLVRERGFQFLQKPYGLPELLEAVREALPKAARAQP